MEARLHEIEAKLSLAEDQIEALNQTVFRQQQQLDLMQNQFRLLYQQVQNALPGEERDLRAEIPPHY